MSHSSFGSVSFSGRTGRAVGTCKSLFLLALAILALGTGTCAFALTPTTTTLAVSSAGSAVTTAPSLTVVTLTATVEAGGTPLTVGQVNFCDAAAAHCTDIHLLGTAQLTSAGTAVMKFRPGIGSHSYKAVFLGTKTYASSFSGDSALTVTATGKGTTTTTIAQSGTFGSYSLTATVTGVANASDLTAPTGTVSFLDTTAANAFLGSAELGAGTAGLSWFNPETFTPGDSVFFVATADFNGDGILDIAIASQGDDVTLPGSITVLLGNADGTFTAAASTLAGVRPISLAVGDFNGDGISDLAVADIGSDTVTILLGNGDGTFTVSSSPATGDYPASVVAGDFNGDGIADLAVACSGSNRLQTKGAVTILLGNGDGTFTATATSPAAGIAPGDIAVGDFKGNGHQDLAVTSIVSNSVTILLGNGDGTFTAGTPLTISGGAYAVVVADFNGDGKADLVVNTGPTETDRMAVFLGNGDGTFAKGPNPGPIDASSAAGLVIGDFNGDGNADFALSGYQVIVFLGAGDGTFTRGAQNPTQQGAYKIAVGDFNADGLADLALPNDSSSAAIEFAQLTFTATATASGISVPENSSTHYVEASYPGDGNYGSSVSGTTGLTTSANLSLSATSLSFGNEPLGYSTNAQNVVLTNTGGSTLAINSLRLTGTNAASFVTSNTCGTSLAAGASCKVGVRFVPGAPGGASAAITLNSSLSSTPQNIVALTGTGIDAGSASLTLSAPSLSFGSEPIGYSTDSQNVILTNSSSTAVVYFKTITLGGPNAAAFVTSNTCGGSVGGFLNPGASCKVGVRFVPGSPVPASALITLIDNASGSPQSIALSGTGISASPASLALSTNILGFGNETVATSTIAEDVVVTNTSTTATLYFKSITLGGANASSFVTSNTCDGPSGNGLGGSLAPRGQCRIGVRFAPKITGPLTATITVTENAPGSPQTITLIGEGR